MKNKILIIFFSFSLLSTRCAQESIYITVDNKSNQEIVMACTSDIALLNLKINQGSYYHGQFQILRGFKSINDTIRPYDLDFYLSNNKKFYTFYLLKIVTYDTITSEYLFEKKYDSINIDKNKITIGKGSMNKFKYEKAKITFESR